MLWRVLVRIKSGIERGDQGTRVRNIEQRSQGHINGDKSYRSHRVTIYCPISNYLNLSRLDIRKPHKYVAMYYGM
eukprot:SAG11_NODE_1931_length_4044_cov_1.223517_4_plen_75_part_00